VMDQAGTCPKCGLKLVPQKKEKRKSSMKIDNH